MSLKIEVVLSRDLQRACHPSQLAMYDGLGLPRVSHNGRFAVDREFLLYIDPPRALPGPPRAPPEPPRADPDLHSLSVPPELSLDVFADFFMDLSAKTATFESISGKTSSPQTLKSRCFR